MNVIGEVDIPTATIIVTFITCCPARTAHGTKKALKILNSAKPNPPGHWISHIPGRSLDFARDQLPGNLKQVGPGLFLTISSNKDKQEDTFLEIRPQALRDLLRADCAASPSVLCIIALHCSRCLGTKCNFEPGRIIGSSADLMKDNRNQVES